MRWYTIDGIRRLNTLLLLSNPHYCCIQRNTIDPGNGSTFFTKIRYGAPHLHRYLLKQILLVVTSKGVRANYLKQYGSIFCKPGIEYLLLLLLRHCPISTQCKVVSYSLCEIPLKKMRVENRTGLYKGQPSTHFPSSLIKSINSSSAFSDGTFLFTTSFPLYRVIFPFPEPT
jgi:hypothetical protein